MRKTTYHHGDLRETILDAAELMLEGRPLSAISMRDLARQAGVSSGAPYHHFSDRSDLILGLCQRAFLRLNEALTRGRKRKGIAGMADEYLKFSRCNRSIYQLMFSPEATEGDLKAALAPYATPVFSLLETAIEETLQPRREEPSDLSAVSVWCFMHGVANLSLASPLQVRLGEKNINDFVYESILSLIAPH